MLCCCCCSTCGEHCPSVWPMLLLLLLVRQFIVSTTTLLRLRICALLSSPVIAACRTQSDRSEWTSAGARSLTLASPASNAKKAEQQSLARLMPHTRSVGRKQSRQDRPACLLCSNLLLALPVADRKTRSGGHQKSDEAVRGRRAI